MSSENSSRETICAGCLTHVIEEDLRKTLVEHRKMSDAELEVDDLQCGIKPIASGTKCPCSACLVKMVCDQTCDKIETYISGYVGELTRLLLK